MEIMWPPGPRSLVARGRQGYQYRVSLLFHGVELPGLGPNETVRGRFGVVCLIAKPGETDGDTTADRSSRFPLRVLAKKDHFLRAGRTPGSKLRAMEVDLRRSRRGKHAYPRQALIAGSDRSGSGNSEALVQFIDSRRRWHDSSQLW